MFFVYPKLRQYWGPCGGAVLVRALDDRYYTPILCTIIYFFYDRIVTALSSQIAECPAVSNGSPNVTKPTKTHIEALTYIGTTENPV